MRPELQPFAPIKDERPYSLAVDEGMITIWCPAQNEEARDR